jgi:hypothetical protein
MKQLSILFFVFLCSLNTQAHDTIFHRNGEVINATIIERSNCKIKYQPTQNTDIDTTLSFRSSKIKSIQYGRESIDRLSSQNPRHEFPLGVNVGADFFLFRPLFNGGVDYLFTPNLSAEINYRSMLTNNYPAFSLFSIGGKYWFANKYSKSGFSPFVGLFFTQWRQKNDEDTIILENKPEWSVINLTEVPLGISYITKSGFQTSFQISLPLLCLEFRVGWRFKTAKKNVKNKTKLTRTSAITPKIIRQQRDK